MNRLQEKVVDAYLASHHGVISRHDAHLLGLTRGQIEWSVRTGRWVAIHRGVYRRAGVEPVPEARILAACRAAGAAAVASHTSAAYLWDLVTDAGTRPSLTLPVRHTPQLVGVDLRRRADLEPDRVIVRRHIPVTDPLRSLADLGEVVPSRVLDGAVDRALAQRLVTVDGLAQEAGRLGRRGRRRAPQLRAALARRGLVGGPVTVMRHPTTLRTLVAEACRRADVEAGARADGEGCAAADVSRRVVAAGS